MRVTKPCGISSRHLCVLVVEKKIDVTLYCCASVAINNRYTEGKYGYFFTAHIVELTTEEHMQESGKHDQRQTDQRITKSPPPEVRNHFGFYQKDDRGTQDKEYAIGQRGSAKVRSNSNTTNSQSHLVHDDSQVLKKNNI